MSKIALEGNSLGSGTFTIAAPNSNSNPTLTLPTSSGTVVVTGGAQTIEFAAGSAASPSITFTGDTNTGIFSPAADTIAFSEGGVESMRIDSSGNVGIGTTSPTGAGKILHLNNSGTDGADVVDLRFTTGTTGATSGDGVRVRLSNAGDLDINNLEAKAVLISTQNTERMRIDSSGNVGIGTSTSRGSALLTVKQNAGAGGGVSVDTPDGYTDGNYKQVGFYAGSTLASYVRELQFTVGASALTFGTLPQNGSVTERARITSGGFFKASNDSSIYVSATGNYHEFGNTNDNSVLYVRNSNASFSNSCVYAFTNRTSSTAYYFYRGASNNAADDEFLLRGDGNAYADGTWNNNGADYAEFFESANGQALTLGATVVLDGNKVREATDQDPASAIIGVVRPKEPSKASMVVGNTAWNKWANKYLTDDFDRYIMEDHDVVEWEETITDEEGKTSTKQHSYESHNIPAGVTVPADAVRKTHDDKGNKFQHYKLNPAWDKDAEYVNRENRPEWNIIGLLGQVKILKGQPVGDRWIKMRDVSATVEEWMIR